MHMKKSTLIATPLLTLALMGADCLGVSTPGGIPQNLSTAQDVDANDATKIVIASEIGNVTLIGEEGRSTIEMTPTLNSDDAEAGTITVLSTGGDATVTVVSNSDTAAADIEIKVPATMDFDIAAGQGDVAIEGITGGGRVGVGDGSTTADLTLPEGADLDLTATGAGGIDLTIPGDTVANLEAAAAGGEVTIDAALTFDGTNVAGAAQGTLNGATSADGTINLASGGGNIAISAAP
jgi:hypothetical protein